MREKSDGAGEVDMRAEGETRRLDLSLPQVAGSALAAVVAAKLASSFGVYGTILGAGVISVVATCGGSVLQHFFKRTGEQLKVKRTAAVAPTPDRETAPAWGEFSQGTVYRARTTGWKRPVIAAALVFGVAMAGITTYELASGENLGGGHRTTVGNALTGHNKSASDSGNSDGPDGPGGSDDSGNSEDGKDPGGSGTSGDDGAGSDTPSATPSGTPNGTGTGESSGGDTGQDGGTATSPTPTPDTTGDEGAGDSGSPAPDDSATAPAPGASSRSGTDGQGQGCPAAP
ncbi:hypothetical protein [Streptomyces parvulus]|uniref:hypothetical protein n=1 Tax=Streptomyces parvulus TaxID=146923 RepID=UPI0036B36869